MHLTDAAAPPWYQADFEKFESGLNGEKSAPRHALRRQAIAKFIELGFPTSKHEEWRFTNIQPIVKTHFEPVLQGDTPKISLTDLKSVSLQDAVRLVVVDGYFSAKLSDLKDLPAGVVIESLADAVRNNRPEVLIHLGAYVDAGENAFTALNAAFLLDGAFISIARQTVVEKPIQIIFAATDRKNPFVAYPRNLIIAGEGAQAKIVETYVGLTEQSYLTNVVTEVVLGSRAVVEHDRLQLEGNNACHVDTSVVSQQAESVYRSNCITLGGLLIRNTLTARLDGEKAECTLNGLSLAGGNQLADNHTFLDHAKPNCTSRQVYKAILDGKSHGVFNGKVMVRKDAQKTDARQTNKTLLLSDDAVINTKPQLEIFANDVKCAHGATIGQLDAEQIFYLRARGLDEPQARDMLIYAFAADMVRSIEIPALREQLDLLIHARLDRRGKGAAQ
jgi:Fe-S cluster assembly protein SufD